LIGRPRPKLLNNTTRGLLAKSRCLNQELVDKGFAKVV
jgi:hypothetical protein